MPRCAWPLLATALLIAGVAAAAPPTPSTHYRWKDAQGVVHFSDTIPASALAGGYDVVSSDGRVIRHVQRELTPAERKAAAAEAAREAAAKRRAQQQTIEDAQLLSAYPDVQSLEASQQGQLRQIEGDIATLETNLRNQEATLTDLLGHAADLEHAKQPIPPYIHKRIAKQRQTINDERHALSQRREDLADARVRFAKQLEHYRELRARYGKNDAGG